MKYDYQTLVDLLRRSVVTVTFTKVDGTSRVMECTLLPQFLPEEFRATPPMLTEQAPQTLSVWDVQAGGWRSFRIDNVTNVSF